MFRPMYIAFSNIPPITACCRPRRRFDFNGFQFRPVFQGRFSLNPVTMLVVDTPVSLDAEPNTKDAPQQLSLPAVVSGRFDTRGDADWFEFTATRDGP